MIKGSWLACSTLSLREAGKAVAARAEVARAAARAVEARAAVDGGGGDGACVRATSWRSRGSAAAAPPWPLRSQRSPPPASARASPPRASAAAARTRPHGRIQTWVTKTTKSETLTWPHGRTAASCWALSGSVARPECAAEPGAWRVSPRRPEGGGERRH